jgi:hypothetical protein
MRIHATFDGKVLLPEEPLLLETSRRYSLTIEEDSEEKGKESQHVLSRLTKMATDLGVPDLAERHDDYALR